MNMDLIDEAAEEYCQDNLGFEVTKKTVFKAGALSEAAKEYWFEQKQPPNMTDSTNNKEQISTEDLQTLAEKEYGQYETTSLEGRRMIVAFMKGYRTALRDNTEKFNSYFKTEHF